MADLKRIMTRIGKWLETDITPFVELKKPNIPETKDYKYERVNPSVYLGSTPPLNLLRGKSIAPSVTVKILKGEMKKGVGQATVRLELAVWNPGTHKNDYVKITGGAAEMPGTEPIEYDSDAGDNEIPAYEFSQDGYWELLSFCDRIVDNLDEKDAACGYRKTSEIRIKSPYDEEPFSGTFPYFYMTLEFDIVYETVRTHREIENILI